MSEIGVFTEDQARQFRELREARHDKVTAAYQRSRVHQENLNRVLACLADGPKTVPEIVEATGFSPTDTLWYVIALKKYGVLGEREKDDGYFRYGLEAAPEPDKE